MRYVVEIPKGRPFTPSFHWETDKEFDTYEEALKHAIKIVGIPYETEGRIEKNDVLYFSGKKENRHGCRINIWRQ